MSVEIKNEQVIFSIPNSEALIKVQRKTEKLRSVGSYYLSQKADEVETALNNLEGKFYIDLSASFLMCKDAYSALIENCKSMYQNDLFYLEEALKDLEWASLKSPESLFFRTLNPVIIEKRKYIKLPEQSINVGIFKTLCLGEISEIVFEKLSSNCFRIFVRPKQEAVPFLKNINSFKNWLIQNGKIR